MKQTIYNFSKVEREDYDFNTHVEVRTSMLFQCACSKAQVLMVVMIDWGIRHEKITLQSIINAHQQVQKRIR